MQQTDAAPWEPTDRQAAVLEAGREAGFVRNVTKLCEQVGISRPSFYKWFKEDAQFRRAWEELPRAAILEHLPAVVAAMLEKALTGDVPAARLIIEMGGEMVQVMNVTYQHIIQRPQTYEEWLVYQIATERELDPAAAMAELKAAHNGAPTNGSGRLN